jgi:hypothetical protein
MAGMFENSIGSGYNFLMEGIVGAKKIQKKCSPTIPCKC